MMKRAASYFLAAILVLLTVSANLTPAQAVTPIQHEHETFFPRGVPASTGCPYPTDNGCAMAPANGVFQDATLLTSAQQSGQNSLLPGHPMTFNIPGVDYPIGYDKTKTLKDPRTINDSVCQSAGTFIDCSSTGGGVVNEVLDGYDFSGTTIGQPAIGIYAPNNHISAGSTLTVTNSKFAVLSNGPGGNGDLVDIGGNFNNLVFKYNVCDGTSADATAGFCIGSGSTGTGSMDVEYNAFTNMGVGRIAGGLTNNSFTTKYNYISGLNSLNTTNHGELMLRNCTGSRMNCVAFDDYEGNFIVWPCCVTFTGSNGDNTTFFPSDGSSDGVTLTSMTISNNIVVVNSPASGNGQPDQALFNSRLSTMGTVTMTGNWVDATGSNDCSISGVKAGGNNVTASTSGNTLTVTGTSSSFNNNPIEPGWLIIHSGFTTTPITAYGTGGGNTGTYTFGGSPQTLGSDSNWTLVPGYSGTPTLTGNYNLADPSHTGIPVAMGLNGPQFTATHCSPHY